MSFTPEFLARAGEDLARVVTEGAPRRLRNQLAGGHRRALRRCADLAVAAAVAVAGAAGPEAADPETADRLQSVLGTFFGDSDAGREIAALLDGKRPDRAELEEVLKDAGHDALSLPELSPQKVFDALSSPVARPVSGPTRAPGSTAWVFVLSRPHLHRKLRAHDL